MWINSPVEYFAALMAQLAIEQDWDEEEKPLQSEAAYEEIGRAVRGYLWGLDSAEAEKLKTLAPNAAILQRHQECLDKINFEYLDRLARQSGIRGFPKSDDDIKSRALAGIILNSVLDDRYKRNRKQRIEEQGRIVQCQMCTLRFHSVDTERIKPYGSTKYERFCISCAAKVKAAKAIYQGMVRARRDKA